MDRHQDSPANGKYDILGPPRVETKTEAADPNAEMNDLVVAGWRLLEPIHDTSAETTYRGFERSRSDADDAERGARS